MQLWRRRAEPRPDGAPFLAMSALLPELKVRLDALLDDQDTMDAVFTEEQERAREQAAQNFRAAGPELLSTATPYLWEYYRATAADFTQEECITYGIPLLPPETDIWTQVTLTNPPEIELGCPP